jgi:hypothetical protein
MIAEAVAQCANPDKFNTGQTAGAWFARRIKNERIANRKVWPTLLCFSQVGVRWLIPASQGPETFRASRGTEHDDSLNSQITVY